MSRRSASCNSSRSVMPPPETLWLQQVPAGNAPSRPRQPVAVAPIDLIVPGMNEPNLSCRVQPDCIFDPPVVPSNVPRPQHATNPALLGLFAPPTFVFRPPTVLQSGQTPEETVTSSFAEDAFFCDMFSTGASVLDQDSMTTSQSSSPALLDPQIVTSNGCPVNAGYVQSHTSPTEADKLDSPRARRATLAGVPRRNSAMATPTSMLRSRTRSMSSIGKTQQNSKVSPPAKSRASCKWTVDDNNLLLALRNEGQSWVQIATALGKTPRAVHVQHNRISSTAFFYGLSPADRPPDGVQPTNDRFERLRQNYLDRKDAFWSDLAATVGCAPLVAECVIMRHHEGIVQEEDAHGLGSGASAGGASGVF